MEHIIKRRKNGRTTITIRAGKGEDVRDSPLAQALGLPPREPENTETKPKTENRRKR